MINFQKIYDKKSLEEQGHLLGDLPRLLVTSEKFTILCQLLANYYFIEAKINHLSFGVQALIKDYDFLQNEILLTEFIQTETISSLKKIQGALRLSAHIINQDSQQLAAQLSGRLLHFHTPEINSLLQQIAIYQGFRCLTPSLTPPGSALIRTLSGHNKSVSAIAITPDGKRVISGSYDNTIKIWEIETGKELFTLPSERYANAGHSESVSAIAITPDGKRVISGSADETIKIWEIETGNELFTLKGHSSSVIVIAITPDGKRVISSSSDNTIKIWEIETGAEIATFTGESPINCCAVAADGVTIVAGEESGMLHFLRWQGR